MENSEHWLSLDLSTPRGGLAIHRYERGRLAAMATFELDGPHRQSELLMPAIETVLKSAKISLPGIDRLVTCSGPGSFTGLRIGYAAVKGFASALRIPIETVSASEARARSYFRAEKATSVVVLSTLTPRSYLWEEYQSHGKITRGERGICAPAELPDFNSRLLVDDRADIGEKSKHALTLPSSASLLAEAIFERDTLQEVQSWDDLIRLAPEYVGGERFATAGR